MSLRRSSCARTDIGFYDFVVRRAPRGHRRAVPEAHEFFDERVWDAMMILPEHEERLEATPRRIMPADVELMSPCLGKGASSTAYLCRLRFARAQTFVVKVPNPVARGVTEYVSDEQPGALPRSVSNRTISSFVEYERELRTMERLLEPDEYAVQRAAGIRMMMTSAEVRRLFLAREALRLHRGYAHIHRVVHVEYHNYGGCGYPMFFSEPCDGTLEALAAASPQTYPDSDAPTWRELARQTVCGFDYMVSRRVGNMDIHCGNIFYKQRGPRTYHYVLADFGGCVFDLDAVSPWTGRTDTTRLRCSLLCLCDEVLNYPFRDAVVEGLKEPYASVIRPLLDESAFVHGCSDAQAKQLYDDLVRVIAPEPMMTARSAVGFAD